MFNKRKIYLLNYIDGSTLKLENETGEEIFKCEIYKDPSGQIDPDQVEYLLKKTLSTIDSKANLAVRISSANNIFRFEKASGLKETDLDSYYTYNIDKILPFNKENFLLKYNYWRENFLVYGIDKDLINIFSNKLASLFLKNIYITTFASEAIAYIENNKIKNVLILRLDESSLELIKVLEADIVFYKYKTFDQKNYQKEIESLSKSIQINNQIEALIFGDKNFINEEKDYIDKNFGIEFSFRQFSIENYFGE